MKLPSLQGKIPLPCIVMSYAEVPVTWLYVRCDYSEFMNEMPLQYKFEFSLFFMIILASNVSKQYR